MTQEELLTIIGLQPADMVGKLQETSYPNLPKWSDLLKQYDPKKHLIWDTAVYPAKLNENGVDEFKRTAFALQKLAVKRVAQSMFSNPVSRKYTHDTEIEAEQKAVDLLEEVYRTQNYIDAENIDRGKKLNASCQIATIWKAVESDVPVVVKDETTKFKLYHKTYSEKDGYKLYPITDGNGNLMVFSVGYKDTTNVEHMDVYINSIGTIKPRYIKYVNKGRWTVDTEQSQDNLEVFPVIYANIEEPVWGGDDGTNIVEQLEEMESFQGLYIKRNALPTFTLDFGELPTGAKRTTDVEEKSDDSRRVIEVGKGGNMTDVTWEGAGEAVDKRYNRLRNAYFEQIQVPDTSFSNMISSNTSAENKELVFADAKANAKDLGGTWEKFFYEELQIVKTIVGVMFSKYASIYSQISCRSVITPYSIKTRLEDAEFVATGGAAMSLETQVSVIGQVDDVNAEADRIREQNSANTNQGIL